MAEKNEKLARGIVAVAELVKDLQKTRDVPDIDQMMQKQQEAKQKNPFEEESVSLNQPAQRSSSQSEQREAPNAPGYMMHPGVRERIPDAEIPPPPPRRF